MKSTRSTQKRHTFFLRKYWRLPPRRGPPGPPPGPPGPPPSRRCPPPPPPNSLRGEARRRPNDPPSGGLRRRNGLRRGARWERARHSRECWARRWVFLVLLVSADRTSCFLSLEKSIIGADQWHGLQPVRSRFSCSSSSHRLKPVPPKTVSHRDTMRVNHNGNQTPSAHARNTA